MSLLVDFMQKKREGKKSKNLYAEKKKEQQVYNELKEKLDRMLQVNDEVMIEVDDRAIEEFMNILDGKISNTYICEQIGYNQFIFKPREIIF